MTFISQEDRELHEKSQLKLVPTPNPHDYSETHLYINAVAVALAVNAKASYNHGESAFAQLEVHPAIAGSDAAMNAQLDQALAGYVVGNEYTLAVSTNDFGDATVASLRIQL